MSQDYDHDGEFFATALAAAAFAVKSMDELRIMDQRKAPSNPSFKDTPLLSKIPSIISTVKSWDNKAPYKTGSIEITREETEADKWEKAQMAKIKERYARMKTIILDWEKKKKGKVRQNKARTESEVDRKRANIMQHYREEIERIEKITGRAKAQAEKNERNETLKVKEKGNKIRQTGKIPATNFLFICF